MHQVGNQPGLGTVNQSYSIYSLFIQAGNMFRSMFSGHLQVTRNVCLEEVIEVSHKMKYTELKLNEISLSFVV